MKLMKSKIEGASPLIRSHDHFLAKFAKVITYENYCLCVILDTFYQVGPGSDHKYFCDLIGVVEVGTQLSLI